MNMSSYDNWEDFWRNYVHCKMLDYWKDLWQAGECTEMYLDGECDCCSFYEENGCSSCKWNLCMFLDKEYIDQHKLWKKVKKF